MAKQGKSKAESVAASAAASDEPELVALVRGFAEIVASHGLSELIVDTKDTTLTLRRGGVAIAAPPAPVAAYVAGVSAPPPFGGHPPPASASPFPSQTAAQAPAVDDKAHVVTSPFVGTFYRKPNPDSASYVSLNERVDKGAVLCIVEAMKLMNEIEADIAGTVVGILVDDGSAVEYGQPLFKILP